MQFPMYTIPLATLLEMTKIEPHEVLMEKGLLAEFRKSIGKAVFVSHQWVETDHPDPDCQQLRILQGAFKKLLAGHWQTIPVDLVSEGMNHSKPLPTSELLAEPLFLWYDYFSCPQSTRCSSCELQHCPQSTRSSSCELQHAISSIAAYVDACDFFFALVPLLENQSRTRMISPMTWGQRGWCRLERTCRELSQQPSWIVVKGTSDLTVISSVTASTYAGSGPVGEGQFSVEEDREKVAGVLLTALKRKLLALLKAQDLSAYRALLNQQPMLLRGLKCDSLQPVPGFEDSGDFAMHFFSP